MHTIEAILLNAVFMSILNFVAPLSDQISGNIFKKLCIVTHDLSITVYILNKRILLNFK